MSDYSNITKVKAEIEEVKGIMGDNIERTIKRGENVECLLDKTNKLSMESSIFRKRAGGLRKKMCMRNIKLISVIVLVIVLIVIIIIIRASS